MTTTVTPSQFASRKAKMENALGSVGLSGNAIENYHRMVSEEAAAIVADIFKNAGTQAAYDVTINVPTGIVAMLGDKQAKRTARQAVVHALAKAMDYDLSDAKAFAVALLEDVNYHDAAVHLAAFDAA